MKTSVIIPAHNEAHLIGECLRSLSMQDYPHLEVIVVDDGSTDRTSEAAGRFGVKVLRQSHQGPAAAKNLGASRAQGEILAFLDADMSFPPDFITRMTAPILRGDAVGTFCRQVYISNPENRWARRWAHNRRNPLRGNIFPRRIPDRWHIFRVILKKEFERVGGFDDVGYGEDATLGKKLRRPALAAPGARLYHHHPSSPGEAFRNALWVGKGESVKEYGRRFWLRFSPPVTLYRGLKIALRTEDFGFILLAILFDGAMALGRLARTMGGRHCR